MDSGTRLVPRDSLAYQEFARLYGLAQALRPTGVDRWNRELYATEADNLGGFDPGTGRISVSGEFVLRHLTGSEHLTVPGRRAQAQALATVLHEATHAGMPTDAPHESNAVRSMHSLGLMEGVAEARTLADFPIFADRAGYSGLSVPEPEYTAAYAAAVDLMQQASGPRKSRQELIADATRGPAVMHFDQLADGVLRNRLHDVVPDRAEDRRAVRAALIGPMMHQGWTVLKDHKDVGIGQAVASDIRRQLDAKVDEIKHHYQAQPARVFPAEGPNAEAVRAVESKMLAELPPPDAADRVEAPVRGAAGPSVSTSPEMRFLDGIAPAAGAVGRRPSLGQGARGAGRPMPPNPERTTERDR